MELIRYLRNASRYLGPLLLLASVISGLANAGLLAIIDHVLKAAPGQGLEWKWLAAFVGVLLLMLGSSRFMHAMLIRLTHEIILRIRLDILNQLRNAPYAQFEHIGQEKIYAALTKDTTVVANLGPNLVHGAISAVTVLVCFVFIAYLSWIAFAAALCVVALAMGLYLLRDGAINKLLDESRSKENTFLKHLEQLLKGFKEIKMDRPRNDDLYENFIQAVAEDNRKLSQRAYIGYVNNGITATLFFFVLLGFTIFAFPSLTGDHATVASIAIIILYMYGPSEGIVNMVPIFATANISFRRLRDLEEEIRGIPPEPQGKAADTGGFQELRMSGIEFDYSDAEGKPLFCLGPLDFELKAGEMVFIVGGNGSGKSTFIRLLTGLYRPLQGQMWLNGEVLSDENYQRFRSLVEPIFSDYFLFDRFYGRPDVDAEAVSRLLRQMELQDKVEFKGGQFTTLDLSTGQRKRLAMVAALLDDKPFFIFDEWAADQDPAFRKYFYEGLLMELKARGKTILAVTHDDRYFHVADRVLKMEAGKMMQL